jgi:hypothetical protein
MPARTRLRKSVARGISALSLAILHGCGCQCELPDTAIPEVVPKPERRVSSKPLTVFELLQLRPQFTSASFSDGALIIGGTIAQGAQQFGVLAISTDLGRNWNVVRLSHLNSVFQAFKNGTEEFVAIDASYERSGNIVSGTPISASSWKVHRSRLGYKINLATVIPTNPGALVIGSTEGQIGLRGYPFFGVGDLANQEWSELNVSGVPHTLTIVECAGRLAGGGYFLSAADRLDKQGPRQVRLLASQDGLNWKPGIHPPLGLGPTQRISSCDSFAKDQILVSVRPLPGPHSEIWEASSTLPWRLAATFPGAGIVRIAFHTRQCGIAVGYSDDSVGYARYNINGTKWGVPSGIGLEKQLLGAIGLSPRAFVTFSSEAVFVSEDCGAKWERRL